MDEFRSACSPTRAVCWTVMLLVLAGCEALGTTKKFSNPVVPPPPRKRIVDPKGAADDSHETAANRDKAPPAGLAALASPGRTRRGAPAQKGSDSSDRTMARSERPDHMRLAVVDEEQLEGDEVAVEHASASTSNGTGGWKGNGSSADEALETDEGLDHLEPPLDELTAMKTSAAVEGAGKKVEKGEVAATVNGVPIFVDDVLRDPRLKKGLEQAQQQLPPEQYHQVRAAEVGKRLPELIKQELLLQALKTKLKDEQLASIKKQIDAQFNSEYLPKAMKDSGASTRGEFEAKLRTLDTNIDTFRTVFRNNQLAQQYVQSKIVHKRAVDRPEIVQHYRDNLDKFAVPAQVKWQQIQLLYNRNGGKAKTRELAAEVVERIRKGEDFGTLARQVSNGPTKKEGGVWDWTTANSLKSTKLNKVLFELPVRDECELIEENDAIDIVYILDRREAGRQSFESVQSDIKKELSVAELNKAVNDLFRELHEHATVETFVDEL
ncbi:MAG: peptidylprolyl isomerase [Planctomycetales bacterium]